MMTIQAAAEMLRQTVVEAKVDDDDGHTEYTWSDGPAKVAFGWFAGTTSAAYIALVDANGGVKANFFGAGAYALLNQLQPLSSLAPPPRAV